MSLYLAYKKVQEFQKAFGQPVGTTPAALTEQRNLLRALWVQQEKVELEESKTVEEQADALLDIIYFALGSFVELGVDPAPLFEIVHNANMQKIWPDGKPHFDETGRVLKPKGWVAPEPLLIAEIERQKNEQLS